MYLTFINLITDLPCGGLAQDVWLVSARRHYHILITHINKAIICSILVIIHSFGFGFAPGNKKLPALALDHSKKASYDPICFAAEVFVIILVDDPFAMDFYNG
jgi:hypothetical protein